MTTQNIIYEQPLNEIIRTCLRLEHSFKQVTHSLSEPSAWDSRLALSGIFNIMTILDRPDLKNKLTKELQRHHDNLSKLVHLPKVDTTRLQTVLNNIHQTMQAMLKMPGKLYSPLQNAAFLDHVRLQLQSGVSNIESSLFRYWLHLPAAHRIQQLTHCYQSFEVIEQAVRLLLSMLRESNAPKLQIATKGFYETSLDPKMNCQLISVTLKTNLPVYPEISVGRHHVCVRFLESTGDGQPIPVETDIDFGLTLGVL